MFQNLAVGQPPIPIGINTDRQGFRESVGEDTSVDILPGELAGGGGSPDRRLPHVRHALGDRPGNAARVRRSTVKAGVQNDRHVAVSDHIENVGKCGHGNASQYGVPIECNQRRRPIWQRCSKTRKIENHTVARVRLAHQSVNQS